MTQTTNDNEVLQHFSYRKLIIPLLIGLGAIAYFIFKDFDAEKLKSINWNFTLLFWLVMAITAIAIRHFFLMYRLKSLTDHEISWYQSFQIISLWEFSSCVTPSSVGGTAVALFFLTKEGISVGRTTTIILITIFLDGLLFTLLAILFWIILGGAFVNSGWAYFFYVGFVINVIMFLVVAYGLFLNPNTIKWLIEKIFSLPYIRRWKHIGRRTAKDLEIASKGLKDKTLGYWLGGFVGTLGAWVMRFLVVNFIILAVVYNSEQLLILARSFILYLVMALSPTPGSSGAAEFSFIRILGEFVPDGTAPTLSFFWRIFSYYIFIPLGFIVLPQWLKRVFSKTKV